MTTIPTNCHNCRNPLSSAEIDEIQGDRMLLAVVIHFQQAACNRCCTKADKHNRR
jgi:hypothetical protein